MNTEGLLRMLDEEDRRFRRKARRRVFFLLPLALLLLFALLLQVREILAASPRTTWRYSDRIYRNDNRTPMSLDWSQRNLKEFIGHDNAGNFQTVVVLDGPIAEKGRLLYWIVRSDTLRSMIALPPEQCREDECTFVGVVDGVAPDSSTAVMVGGSIQTLALNAKDKR